MAQRCEVSMDGSKIRFNFPYRAHIAWVDPSHTVPKRQETDVKQVKPIFFEATTLLLVCDVNNSDLRKLS